MSLAPAWARTFSAYIGSVAIPLLVTGIASRGWGMRQKHRLEAKADYAPA